MTNLKHENLNLQEKASGDQHNPQENKSSDKLLEAAKHLFYEANINIPDASLC